MGSHVLISLYPQLCSNGSYSVTSSSPPNSNVKVEIVEILAKVGIVEEGEVCWPQDMPESLSYCKRDRICLPCEKGKEKEGIEGRPVLGSRGSGVGVCW